MHSSPFADDAGKISLALSRAAVSARAVTGSGQCASYIPVLSETDPSRVGAAAVLEDGHAVECGDSRHSFTIQSISKILTLAYVMTEIGEDAVFSRVGKEPTGDPFNSIIRLETSETRKPYNPLINAGALVAASLVPGSDVAERFRNVASFAAKITGRDTVEANASVALSEKATASRNRSIAWFLDNLGILERGVDETLDLYFLLCAIELDALALARIGAFFAFDGTVPGTSNRLIDVKTARTVKGLMMTCGLYDASGEFAANVGIPAKSGVGGGIVASVKGRMGIGTYGPALDIHGNSVAGLSILASISDELGLAAL